MPDRHWTKVLDTLYDNGGYGEYPIDDTECELDPNIDLTQQLDLTADTIDEVASRLDDSGLAKVVVVGNITEQGEIDIDSDEERRGVKLEEDGFSLAHDRDRERRNRELAKQNRASNRAVALLTLVLAFVGIAQATALTSRVAPNFVSGGVAAGMWFISIFFLAIIYLILHFTSGDVFAGFES